jgi:hypothetical protein
MSKFRLAATSDKIWNREELIVFLNKNQRQEIKIEIDPEAVCLEHLGLYKILDCFEFSEVSIYTENPLECHDKYKIVFWRANPWLQMRPNIDSSLHCWTGKKIFFCLFHRPTASRLGLASNLLACHAEKSYIHFSTDTSDDSLIQFELDKLLEYHSPSIKHAGTLIDQLPLLLAPRDRYTYNQGYFFDDPLTNFYREILIDVVVESHVAGNTFYPTEKTARAIWLKKPFIMFASQNFLDHMHQMGFKTFCNYWSEDYDGYQGRERYRKIIQLLDDIAKKSASELQDMYQHMQGILEHNYNLLKHKTYNEDNIKKIV